MTIKRGANPEQAALERCICGHRDQPHMDEGGEWTWCMDCWFEAGQLDYPCQHWIPRVAGWDYVR